MVLQKEMVKKAYDSDSPKKHKKKRDIPMVWDRSKIVPLKNDKELLRVQLNENERKLFRTYEMPDSDDEKSSSTDSEEEDLDDLQFDARLKKKIVKKRKETHGLTFSEYVYNKKKTWEYRKKYFDATDKQIRGAFKINDLKEEFLRKKH